MFTVHASDEESNVLYEISSEYAFKELETFDSYEAVVERLNQHSQHDFVYYWRRDSRTVRGAQFKTSRPVSHKLKYYSIRLACVFGGQKFSSKGRGKRITQTMRTNCPAFVFLRASKCGNYLQVISVCNYHNHEISGMASKTLPQHRKLPGDVKEEVMQLLKCKIDKRKIIQYVQLRTGVQLIPKNIYNLSAELKSCGEYNSDDNDNVLKRIQDFIREKDSNLSEKLNRNLTASLINDNDRSTTPEPCTDESSDLIDCNPIDEIKCLNASFATDSIASDLRCIDESLQEDILLNSHNEFDLVPNETDEMQRNVSQTKKIRPRDEKRFCVSILSAQIAALRLQKRQLIRSVSMLTQKKRQLLHQIGNIEQLTETMLIHY